MLNFIVNSGKLRRNLAPSFGNYGNLRSLTGGCGGCIKWIETYVRDMDRDVLLRMVEMRPGGIVRVKGSKADKEPQENIYFLRVLRGTKAIQERLSLFSALTVPLNKNCEKHQ